ncbi:MAG: hypothetical protein LW817_08985 [Candidatus Caenarcaniphilales bacterium]|jgi:hypothetical protein|nr:hypothetical protein [Candidatus Caenarcaniphilales bacterium]
MNIEDQIIKVTGVIVEDEREISFEQKSKDIFANLNFRENDNISFAKKAQSFRSEIGNQARYFFKV